MSVCAHNTREEGRDGETWNWPEPWWAEIGRFGQINILLYPLVIFRASWGIFDPSTFAGSQTDAVAVTAFFLVVWIVMLIWLRGIAARNRLAKLHLGVVGDE